MEQAGTAATSIAVPLFKAVVYTRQTGDAGTVTGSRLSRAPRSADRRRQGSRLACPFLSKPHGRKISGTVDQSDDEDPFGGDLVDPPVTAEEELTDRLVAELGHHAAAVRELCQRVGCGEGVAGENARVAGTVASDILCGRASPQARLRSNLLAKPLGHPSLGLVLVDHAAGFNIA